MVFPVFIAVIHSFCDVPGSPKSYKTSVSVWMNSNAVMGEKKPSDI